MDAAVLLALASKLAAIFQEEESFISVPIGLPSYTPEQFSAIPHAPGSSGQLLQLSEFSRLVNQKPDRVVWRAHPSTPLWSIVAEILKTAVISREKDLPESASQYQDALSVLRREKESGVYVDSEELKTYRQYEDAWRLLVQRQRAAEAKDAFEGNRKIQGQSLNMRSQLESLESDWRESGFKEQVENAFHTLQGMASRRTWDVWEDWRLRFMDSLDQFTDLQGNRFVPTVYAPSNVVESPAWITIEIDREELNSLIGNADPKLAAAFGVAEDSQSAVRGVELQATSVSVVRSWLPHDLFSVRFWRFRDPEKTIPWDGYVVGLILIRNVRVLAEPENDTGDTVADPDTFVGTDASQASRIDRETVQRKTHDKRVGIAVLASALVFSVLMTLQLGTPAVLPTWAMAGVTTGLIYALFLAFRPAIRDKRFKTSRFGAALRWAVVIILIAIFAWSLIVLNRGYASITSGEFFDSCTAQGIEGGDGAFKAAVGCVLFSVIGSLFFLSILFAMPVLSGLALLWMWLVTRYRPLQRISRYFKDRIDDESYTRLPPVESESDELHEVPQTTDDPADVRDYPDRIFIAGFVNRPLGRVPNPDESLDWRVV